MKNNDRGKPMDGIDKKFSFVKYLFIGCGILVFLILSYSALLIIHDKDPKLEILLPTILAIASIVMPLLKKEFFID
ncbi:hypothetical protein AGMMS50267_06430 [Spirochaetia bacterium]|nr:hypothetical protein AGMMS50267_06430 [Spirochaetia bacterium]